MKNVEDIKGITEVAENLRSNLMSRGKEPKIKISSLPILNRKIWGLREREMVVVGARTSNGKSAFSIQLAIDVAEQGLSVWFISLEMSEEDIMERMFCNSMQVDNMDLLKGGFSTNKEIQRKFNAFQSIVYNWEMLITEGIGYSFEEIIKVYDAFDTKPKVIVLDYIQGVSTRIGQTTDTLSHYVMKLREFGVKNNLSVILVSQINRDSKNGKPENYQLKNTGKLEEHADKVILLHWPWLTDPSEPFEKYIMRVSKNRNGRTGVHECQYKPAYYKFSDI